MNELKNIFELIEEDRQAKIKAYMDLPFVNDLVNEDIARAIAQEKHIADL